MLSVADFDLEVTIDFEVVDCLVRSKSATTMLHCSDIDLDNVVGVVG